MVDVLEFKKLLQRLKEILLARNMKGILERQWTMKKGYVMKCKLELEFTSLCERVSAGG